MGGLDNEILLFLNRQVGREWIVDRVLLEAIRSSLIKLGLPVALLWWAWGRRGFPAVALPALRAIVATVAAVGLARALQNLLPPRVRPLHDPEIIAAGFRLSPGLDPHTLRDWGSFPSDHAVLAFVLATSVFLVHRRAGLFALAWALVVVCLPRVYFGLHYPSDILGGAMIGAAIAVLASGARLPRRLTQGVETAARLHPGVLYGVLFLATFQAATLFADARGLVDTSRAALASLLQQP
ncbi:phosphatase PAP2 family protein [Roseococcus sp. DSY-14]|uniref:phosphatase PAP2 family protein n=1 Tax=Roseococcus sp. DSY-14 TaxID=3369650 RepID=UPI00387B8673